MVDLNTLVPPGSSLQLTYALAINDRGEIAGIGVPAGVPPQEYPTKAHAYILLPCDSDHAGVEGCDYDPADLDALAASAPGIGGSPSTTASQHPSRSRFANKFHN
jgi:hypothetical protein